MIYYGEFTDYFYGGSTNYFFSSERYRDYISFRIGELTGCELKAKKIVMKLKSNLDKLNQKISGVKTKSSVIVIEWLEPVMIAGHWVPEMVERAGGKMLLSKPYEKSRQVGWQEVVKANPDMLIFAPCGFDIERTKKEIYIFTLRPEWETLKAVREKQIFFVDGDAYLTRSGPRLIEGCLALARIFHPELSLSFPSQSIDSLY